MLVGGLLGSSLWLFAVDDYAGFPISVGNVFVTILFMPVNNTLGVLICWQFYSFIESVFITIGSIGSAVSIVNYVRCDKRIWLKMLVVTSAFWSIKSVFNFQAMMSV